MFLKFLTASFQTWTINSRTNKQGTCWDCHKSITFSFTVFSKRMKWCRPMPLWFPYENPTEVICIRCERCVAEIDSFHYSYLRTKHSLPFQMALIKPWSINSLLYLRFDISTSTRFCQGGCHYVIYIPLYNALFVSLPTHLQMEFRWVRARCTH